MITEIHTFERKAEAEAFASGLETFAAGAKRTGVENLEVKQAGVIVEIRDNSATTGEDETKVIGHDRKTALLLEAIKASEEKLMTNDDIVEWFRCWARKAKGVVGWVERGEA